MDMRPLSERWGVWKSAAVSGPVIGLLLVVARPELRTVPRATIVILAMFLLIAAGRAVMSRRDRRREAWQPPRQRPSGSP